MKHRFDTRLVRLLEQAARHAPGARARAISIRSQSATRSATRSCWRPTSSTSLRFRLAGTRVCALFCRELKARSFARCGATTSRETDRATCSPSSTEENDRRRRRRHRPHRRRRDAELEMLLLPLAHAGHARIRALGVLAPLAPPYWLGDKPVAALDLGDAAPHRRRAGQSLRRASRVGRREAAARCGTASWSISGGRAEPRAMNAPANGPLTIAA